MIRRSRTAAVAAVLLTALLALPAGASASRSSVRPAAGEPVVATESVWSLVGSYFQATWVWITTQFDEDNGYIVP